MFVLLVAIDFLFVNNKKLLLYFSHRFLCLILLAAGFKIVWSLQRLMHLVFFHFHFQRYQFISNKQSHTTNVSNVIFRPNVIKISEAANGLLKGSPLRFLAVGWGTKVMGI